MPPFFSGPSTARMRRRATLARSIGLLRDFRYEQSDPPRFYGALARDTAELVADLAWLPLQNALVLDVGGGPGYFEDAFDQHGAVYLPVEPDPTEAHAAGITSSRGVRGSGLALPFADESVDVCLSSNVAEHVADWHAMGAEMLRVTRPGGMVILSYTCWYGPFGGHEMGLSHYLGGERAARRFTRKHGHPPKNLYGTSLFKVGAADGLRWARSVTDGESPPAHLVAAFPRYHPWWAWWILRVPVAREVLTSNLVLVLKKL